MKILSIDVGIKNLAYCLFDKSSHDNQFKVTNWDIIDISEQEEIVKCCATEKNVACDKPAKFTKNAECYCLKHAKKQPSQIPLLEHSPAVISKQKVQKLYEIADNHKINYPTKAKKPEMVAAINDYISNVYFHPIETKKACDVGLFHIGLNIKTKFNKTFGSEEKIDFVIIENQISPIATRMKTIQGMIVQYFIMSGITVDQIEFISASNKLKDCDAIDKTNYSNRKKLGIAKCLGIITDDFRFNEHIEYFNKHKKKDDLSDSFLQGMWFINNKQL